MRISCLLCCWLILTAVTSSVHLRPRLATSLPVACLMYCWVMPEPPLCPPVACNHSARTMAFGSKPGFCSKLASSAAYTACWTGSGMSE